MTASYLPYDPQQQFLPPHALPDWLPEPPNAWVKSVLGFRQFGMRGLAKSQAEWKLVCAALNLRRMAKMMYA